MLVPKATMDKDHLTPAREYHIRIARQILSMEAKPEAERMSESSDSHLWLHALALDRSHVGTALLRSDTISH